MIELCFLTIREASIHSECYRLEFLGRTRRAHLGGAARLFGTVIAYAFNCLSALGMNWHVEPQRVASPQRHKGAELSQLV